MPFDIFEFDELDVSSETEVGTQPSSDANPASSSYASRDADQNCWFLRPLFSENVKIDSDITLHIGFDDGDGFFQRGQVDFWRAENIETMKDAEVFVSEKNENSSIVFPAFGDVPLAQPLSIIPDKAHLEEDLLLRNKAVESESACRLRARLNRPGEFVLTFGPTKKYSLWRFD